MFEQVKKKIILRIIPIKNLKKCNFLYNQFSIKSKIHAQFNFILNSYILQYYITFIIYNSETKLFYLLITNIT